MSVARARPRGRSAFTIVELLVAFGILSVALVVIFQIWRSVTKGATVEIWATDAAGRLTTADTRLREFLARAGFPTVVTSQGLIWPTVATQAGYLIQVNATGDAADEPVPGGETRHLRVFPAQGTEGSGDGEGTAVVLFHRVQPAKVGVEGQPNVPVTGSRIRILLKRGHLSVKNRAPLADLVMEEREFDYPPGITLSSLPNLETNPPLVAGVRNHLMVPNVSRMKVSARTREGANLVEIASSGQATDPCVLRIEVECLDPYHGQRRVYKMVEAETHIGVAMGATL